MHTNSNFFHDLYSWFAALGAKNTEVTDEALNRFFEPDFTMTVNGDCFIKSRDDFKQHLNTLIKQPGEITFILPFKNLVIEGSKAVVNYEVHYHQTNNSSITHVIGIYTMSQNGKAQSKLELNHTLKGL